MHMIAAFIDEVLSSNGETVKKVRRKIDKFVKRFPLYKDLIRKL